VFDVGFIACVSRCRTLNVGLWVSGCLLAVCGVGVGVG